MNKLTEKLKDKNYVRAFGLMEPEEQECFKKVGKRNCLSYTNIGWSTTKVVAFSDYITYAIKTDYQPEPEYVDLEIVLGKTLFLGVEFDDCLNLNVPHKFVNLHCLPSLPNFECFWYCTVPKGRFGDQSLREVNFDDVATRIERDKKTVYARLRA